MICPKYDFHIHTAYLKCANETMIVADIVRECARLGVKTIGITDHLNSLDKLPLHAEIKRDIEALDPGIEIYFGVELNFMGCDGPFAFNEEVKAKYGFQFAIGGIHALYLDQYDPRKIVDVQHRHHLKTCEDPLVQVLVHPYWFGDHEFKAKNWPWFDSVKAVPEAYAHELGQVARDTGTAIELNATANLCPAMYGERYVEEYIEYMSIIANEGPMFSVSTDAHNIHQLATIEDAWRAAERIGITEDRIWRPKGAPMKSRSGE